MATPHVRALVFDVFGTVVDWRTGVIDAAKHVAAPTGATDWGGFADAWRIEGYLAPIGEIVTGVRPYADVEDLLREKLVELLDRHALRVDDHDLDWLAKVWRRLDPWPDAPEGLDRLRRRYTLAPLSNGSFALLTEMAKRAGLRWDCVISTELFGAYKPDPRTYEGAAGLLDLPASEVMLVAAHPLDLRAAGACGLRTAYVPRPLEWGADAPRAPPPDPDFDVVADDFGALADALGAEDPVTAIEEGRDE
ncbi:MAG: haloacid dehalogenase type II [Acidimicrobiales bacterium]